MNDYILFKNLDDKYLTMGELIKPAEEAEQEVVDENAEEKKEEITETVTVEDIAKEVPETVEEAEEDKANKLADLRNKYSR